MEKIIKLSPSDYWIACCHLAESVAQEKRMTWDDGSVGFVDSEKTVKIFCDPEVASIEKDEVIKVIS